MILAFPVALAAALLFEWVDWNDAKVIVPVVLSAIAIATSAWVALASNAVSKSSKDVAAVNTYCSLEARLYDHPIVRLSRRTLGSKIVHGETITIPDATPLLRVVDLVAWNVRHGVLPAELVWSGLGDLILIYWWTLKPTIDEYRHGNSASYFENTAWLITELDRFSEQDGDTDWIGQVPAEVAKSFFERESQLAIEPVGA